MVSEMRRQRQKTIRSFRCRDDFWATFEQMGQELECSVDYLINDAMKQYAMARGYVDRTGASTRAPAEASERTPAHHSRQPTGARPRPSNFPEPAAARGRGEPTGNVARQRPEPAARPRLRVTFQDQAYEVTADEFVIGRGSKSADLPIRDGNISRRHAAIVYDRGAWYVKDLGSTNGIEFEGKRIESRKLVDGDIITVCDYDLLISIR